jgi:hypothetical protein
VRVFEPINDLGPLVPLVFLVSHPNDERVDIVPEYSRGGGPFQPATAATISDALQGLPASRHTLDYRFIWNAGADVGLGVTDMVTVRLTASDAAGASAAHVSRPFRIDTTPPAPLPATTPEAIMPVTLAAESGDAQKGMAGYWLRDPLKVRVRDRAQQPLAGVRVAFSLVPSTPGLTADIEEDPFHSATTGVDGIAAVRVRPHAGVSGPLRILAKAAGVPALSVPLTAQVFAPKIVAVSSNPAGPLAYGLAYGFSFILDGDNDPATVDYWVERAPRLELETVNADVSDTVREASDAVWAGMSLIAARFECVPRMRTGNVELRVSVAGDPTIILPPITLQIDSAPQARRLKMVRPQRTYEDVYAFLEAVSGNDPATGGAQVAYPGLTLATPFRFRPAPACGCRPGRTTGRCDCLARR